MHLRARTLILLLALAPALAASATPVAAAPADGLSALLDQGDVQLRQQDPAGEGDADGGLPDRPQLTVAVFILESGCPSADKTFCFVMSSGRLLDDLVLPTGVTVTFVVRNDGSSAHDLTLLDNAGIIDEANTRSDPEDAKFGSDLAKTPLLDPGQTADLIVTLKEEATGAISFVCSVAGHDSLGMSGSFNVGGAVVEEPKHIEEYGVDYLAHWVGIISFIILVAILAIFYFLFRYGETREYVDHRTGGAKPVKTAEVAWMQVVSPKLVAVMFFTLLVLAIVVILAGAAGGA